MKPEYPGPQQSSYHFAPRPIDPDPPMSPEEFKHWFEDQAWPRTAFRKLSKRFTKARSLDIISNDVVNEKIPKRDSMLEEQDVSREIFWGLYVVEKRSWLMSTFYSFVFLLPSVYFFFAWLFQWRHHNDLQNASVPITLSIGFLGTFWGSIFLTSPRFAIDHRIH